MGESEDDDVSAGGESGKEHRWVASVVYTVTAEQIEAAESGQVPLVLDAHNRVSIAVGCWDCERTYAEVVGTGCSRVDADTGVHA